MQFVYIISEIAKTAICGSLGKKFWLGNSGMNSHIFIWAKCVHSSKDKDDQDEFDIDRTNDASSVAPIYVFAKYYLI